MTRAELIAALETATGPSYALDEAISIWRYTEAGEQPPANSRPYTASIDAALALVPAAYDAIIHTAGGADVWRPNVGLRDANMCYAPTPAIALCIAALKAQEGGV